MRVFISYTQSERSTDIFVIFCTTFKNLSADHFDGYKNLVEVTFKSRLELQEFLHVNQNSGIESRSIQLKIQRAL